MTFSASGSSMTFFLVPLACCTLSQRWPAVKAAERKTKWTKVKKYFEVYQF